MTACISSASPTAAPTPVAEIISSTDESSLIKTTGAFFALSVADIDATADWYSEKLGLQITMQ